MPHTMISVTEAARHLAKYVERAHFQNESFTLLKNGIAIARLVPADRPVCRGADLARVLAGLELSGDEAVAWSQGLRAAREPLRPPIDRWM